MPRRLSEEMTRKEMIDPQLEKRGWYLRDHTKVKIEIPVDGYDAEPRNGVTDCCLYRENGEMLALVEAKKTAVDVRLAVAQLTHYVTEIEKHQSFRPFGFLTNGYEVYFGDVGISAKRKVFGFFCEDLEVTPEKLKKVCTHITDSSLGLVRQVLGMTYLPDYKDLVARQFESYTTQHNYSADQIHFLRSVQSVFLQKCHLETADLYEPPQDIFGADAVDPWFGPGDVVERLDSASMLSTGMSFQ